MRTTILILCCTLIVSCGRPSRHAPAEQKPAGVKSKPGSQRAEKTGATPEKQVTLPDHKFSPSTRPGRTKSQIRAIVKIVNLTEADFRETTVDLCRKHESRAAGSFLVQFFSDASCLERWDGEGLLRDSDWPYWLCRVTVETDTGGNLYAGAFKLAVDENTGKERADVLTT